MMLITRALMLCVLTLAVAMAPQDFLAGWEGSPRQVPPRFRAGANLVRVDAYVSEHGVALADLTAQDFEVLEDSVPQRIDSFEVIRPRGPNPQAARIEPSSAAEVRGMAEDPDARVFVLFMDVGHVHLESSARAQDPIVNLLDRVIGEDDLIGVMTPEMSARNLTFARRMATIQGLLKNNAFWGERDRMNAADPRERELELCYPDAPGRQTQGLAEQLISRRRERQTLDALQDLVVHLEGLREERKFVVVISEGWLVPARNDRLAAMIGTRVPGREGVSVGPDDRLTQGGPTGAQSYEACERARLRLASEDLQSDFRFLLQRANRANVSFYAVDPRGLVVFDRDLSSRDALNPATDAARVHARQSALRELAEATDGVAVLNASNIDGVLRRMLADMGTYYLLGYYSTNTRLDGKFRKLTVRVKRPGAEVRARPGYLAPTEADAASARVDALLNGSPPGHSATPPELRRALEQLAPARGNVSVHVLAAGGAGQIWITTEIDVATAKAPEWERGGLARILVEHDRGATPAIEADVTLEPRQRTFSLVRPEREVLPSGRYVIRLSLLPNGSALPLHVTADVNIPQRDALISASGIVSRRGPSTGLQYQPTADARFRRTERLRFAVPRLQDAGTVSARLLGRDGQALPLTVTLGEQLDQTLQQRMIVADLALAPLAQGEYVLEVSLEKDGKTERAAYGFRIVP